MISRNSSAKIIDLQAGEMILINKPIDWTSFDIIKCIRIFVKYECNIKKIKIGHAGTLDPKANGLMILCTGRSTKKIEEFQVLDKEYTGTFTLGATTPSYDSETETNGTFSTDHINKNLIISAAAKLTGSLEQVPPIYSALKVDGKKAYIYARKNKPIKMKAREIKIYEFEITRIQIPEIDFRVVCSKGTYIRSLANDFGKELNSGAYLSALCRTKIGDYKLEDALEITELKELLKQKISI